MSTISGVVAEPRTRRPAKTWLVREGDSLRTIARKVYGNESLWTAIRDANRAQLGRDDAIRAGAELTIPFDGI